MLKFDFIPFLCYNKYIKQGGINILSKNRLNLNFSLTTDKERINFINDYLKNFNNPTNDELETIANYVLWGRTDTGKNVV